MLVHALAMIVLGVEWEPVILDDFRVPGSDGKRYNLASLTAGKPALIFYLNSELKEIKGKAGEYVPYGFERPLGVSDINRLSAMAKGKLRVFATTFADPPELAAQWKRSGLKVPLLGNPDRSGKISFSLVDQMLNGHGHRNLCHLQNMLLIPDGRAARIWSGYSRKSLDEMQALVAKWAGVKLRLDLSQFPKKNQAGGTMMFGLPGP